MSSSELQEPTSDPPDPTFCPRVSEDHVIYIYLQQPLFGSNMNRDLSMHVTCPLNASFLVLSSHKAVETGTMSLKKYEHFWAKFSLLLFML